MKAPVFFLACNDTAALALGPNSAITLGHDMNPTYLSHSHGFRDRSKLERFADELLAKYPALKGVLWLMSTPTFVLDPTTDAECVAVY